MTEKAHWWVYVVQCSDGSLYTGITTDVERRVREHNESEKGARYTRARRPVELCTAWNFETRSEALKEERRFKSLSRPEKLKALTPSSDYRSE
jgi:putative endonuclease